MKSNISIKINGYQIYSLKEHPGSYLGYLFLNAWNMNYWSFESLTIFYYESIKLVLEYSKYKRKELKGSNKSAFTRFISYGHKSLLTRKFKDRETVLSCIYNLILKFEGLGFLRGFGMLDNQGKIIRGNPEYKPMMNIAKVPERRLYKEKKEIDYKQITIKRKDDKMDVKFADLKSAIKALNEMDFIEKKIKFIGVKKTVLVELFLKGVESCPKESVDMLSEEIKLLNNQLIDAEEASKSSADPPEDVPETKEYLDSDVVPEDGPEDPPEDENKEECSEMGEGYEKTRKKCQACLDSFPEDYVECRKKVTAKKKKKASEKAARKAAKKDGGEVSTKVKKPKPKVKPVKEKKKRYTRNHAFAEAMKKGGTLTEISEALDNFYLVNGGRLNIKSAKHYANHLLGGLMVMGFITKEGKGKEAVHTLN